MGLVHRRDGHVGLPAALVLARQSSLVTVAGVRLWPVFAPNVALPFSLVSAGLSCDLVYNRSQGSRLLSLVLPRKTMILQLRAYCFLLRKILTVKLRTQRHVRKRA